MKLHHVGCFQMEAARTAIWKIVFREAVDLWKRGISIQNRSSVWNIHYSNYPLNVRHLILPCNRLSSSLPAIALRISFFPYLPGHLLLLWRAPRSLEGAQGAK